jgi:peptidoglycan hydrolase-like protein with peptidoglycan-binding domain
VTKRRAAAVWLVTSFLLLLGAVRVPLGAAPAPSSKAARKKSSGTNKAAPVKSNRSRSVAKANSSKRTVGKRGGRRRGTPSDHYTVIGQQRPAPERVMEIERALVQRGLLTGEPDGTWDDTTTDALRRFQQQSNLKADGKLSAHSLVALGLGPRRGGPPPAVNPQPPPAPAASPAVSAPPPAPPETKEQPQR